MICFEVRWYPLILGDDRWISLISPAPGILLADARCGDVDGDGGVGREPGRGAQLREVAEQDLLPLHLRSPLLADERTRSRAEDRW